MHRIKRYLITGLIVVVPVSLTVYILVVIFRFIDNILGKFITGYLKSTLGWYIPGIGFLLFFLVIFLIGLLASRFFGHRVFPRIEKWFAELPLINSIYPTLKQIVLFLLAKREVGFKKAVLIDYPCKGILTLGFLTNEQFKNMGEVTEKDMVSVFVPTTPGPFSGFVVFVPKSEVRFIDISISDALKIIISGGVFRP